MGQLHRGNLLQEAMDRIDRMPIAMTVEAQLAILAPAFAEHGLVAWVHGLLESYQDLVSGRSCSPSLLFIQLAIVSTSIDHVAHNSIRNRARRIAARTLDRERR